MPCAGLTSGVIDTPFPTCWNASYLLIYISADLRAGYVATAATTTLQRMTETPGGLEAAQRWIWEERWFVEHQFCHADSKGNRLTEHTHTHTLLMHACCSGGTYSLLFYWYKSIKLEKTLPLSNCRKEKSSLPYRFSRMMGISYQPQLIDSRLRHQTAIRSTHSRSVLFPQQLDDGLIPFPHWNGVTTPPLVLLQTHDKQQHTSFTVSCQRVWQADLYS